MIELDRNDLFGKGLHRECFVHPQRPDRCVKIVVAGSSNENLREARYYGSLARRGISWDMLARFHGLVQTNRGEGAVFDLVRDHNGEISHTLAHYLENRGDQALQRGALASSLAALQAYLLSNRIITMTLKAKNILWQKTAAGVGKLVIVDNVGNSDFIPIANYNKMFARRKIQRKWLRFEQALRREYAGIGPALPGSAGPAAGAGAAPGASQGTDSR